MYEQPSSPTTSTPASLSGRSLALHGFAVSAALILPLVVIALIGERVDTATWLVPLALPVVFAMYWILAKAPDGEAARQAADISRWEL